MSLFKIIWTVDALAALVVIYFFIIGIADGSVSSRNMSMWMGMLAGLAVILFGSIWLRQHNYIRFSYSLLSVLAIPASLYLVFILVAMFGKGRWN